MTFARSALSYSNEADAAVHGVQVSSAEMNALEKNLKGTRVALLCRLRSSTLFSCFHKDFKPAAL